MGLPRDGKKSAQNVGDPSSTPGSGRSPGGENGNRLEYSCPGIPWSEEPEVGAGRRLQSVGLRRVGRD